MEKTLERANINGEISIPSSKSETIRALLISTFAKGVSVIHRPLQSKDTESCIEICQKLRATVTPTPEGDWIVDSTKLGYKLHDVTLDCANSGTTMYLATSLVASLGIKATFTGDAQLRSRPVGSLLACLRGLGVSVEPTNAVYPPFTIKGPIKGGNGTIICKTSQFLSSLLLGTPLAEGPTTLDIPLLYEKPYVRITMEFLDSQNIRYNRHQDLQHFEIEPLQHFTPQEWTIDGDFSSASFFFGAAAITGGTVTIRGLRQSDPQGDKGILRILTSMGCTVTWNQDSVTVQGPKTLHGGSFDLNSMPDTLPILAVVSCFADSPVHLVNVPQARIKETDRISLMKLLLIQIGAKVTETPDGLIINGNNGQLLEGGRKVDGQGDHRIVMAMAIASLRCREPLTLIGAQAVEITFPNFFALLDSLKR